MSINIVRRDGRAASALSAGNGRLSHCKGCIVRLPILRAPVCKLSKSLSSPANIKASRMAPHIIPPEWGARHSDRPDLGTRSAQRLFTEGLEPWRMAGTARERPERRRARGEALHGRACAGHARLLPAGRADARLWQ